MFGKNNILDIRNNNELDVLIVDDNSNNLSVLSSILKQDEYRIRMAKNGKMALKTIEVKPPDIILLDINMPHMDGFELIKILKDNEEYYDIPVIFITAMSNIENKVKGFDMGAVDYITKPFLVDEVRERVSLHLRLSEMKRLLMIKNEDLISKVADSVKEITRAHLSTIHAMIELSEARDDDTGKHIQRISVFCKQLAILIRETYLSDCINDQFIYDIEISSPLHDIGKISIPDSILLKPGKLSDDEFEKMKSHVTLGADKLKAISVKIPDNSFIKIGEMIARYHHEKWDGSGYTEGLKGYDIPLEARIMAISDVYDALRSKRVYKEAYTHEKAIEIMKELSGTHFDPEIFEVFDKNQDWFKDMYDQLSEVEG